MDRFFSPDNLKHYRRLAVAKLPGSERKRILEALAEQWNVFRREYCGSTVKLPIVFVRPRPISKSTFNVLASAKQCTDTHPSL